MRRGGEPRHRHLVRPRTSPEGSRQKCATRPSPPPWPRQPQATSASLSGCCATAGQRHSDGKGHNSLPETDHRQNYSLADGDPLHGSEESGGPDALTVAGLEAPWGQAVKREQAPPGVVEGPPSGRQPDLGLSLPSTQPRTMCRTNDPRPRGGGSASSRARAGVARRRGRAPGAVGGRLANHQPSRRPEWNARFWTRDRDADVPAVSLRRWCCSACRTLYPFIRSEYPPAQQWPSEQISCGNTRYKYTLALRKALRKDIRVDQNRTIGRVCGKRKHLDYLLSRSATVPPFLAPRLLKACFEHAPATVTLKPCSVCHPSPFRQQPQPAVQGVIPRAENRWTRSSAGNRDTPPRRTPPPRLRSTAWAAS